MHINIIYTQEELEFLHKKKTVFKKSDKIHPLIINVENLNRKQHRRLNRFLKTVITKS
jgi:hypothetical protein